MKPLSKLDQLRRLAARGPFRARESAAEGIPRSYVGRLVAAGELERVGRGVYRRAGRPGSEAESLAEVCLRVPHAVICLLSALQFHGLTTELPHAVWILIDTRARAPKLDTPALEIVRAHGEAREHGVERRRVDGVEVRVTSHAKTVADCFRYRRHVGTEVALSALREYLTLARGRDRPASVSLDALLAAARADRVSTVMRPYLEAMT